MLPVGKGSLIMKKLRFPSELCYLLGLVIMAAGTAFMNRAELGVSMVVAPAKVFSMKTGFSFGWSDVILQVVLLLALCIVMRRFRVGYLFSFATAFFYGRLLDLFIFLMTNLPSGNLLLRILWAFVGMAVTAVGVAFFLHTYFAPESYDLFVREVSEKFKIPFGKFKTAYDCVSLAIAVIMTFALFGTQVFEAWGRGSFEGIGPATIVCAVINGAMIAACSRWMQKHLDFFDLFPIAKYFK